MEHDHQAMAAAADGGGSWFSGPFMPHGHCYLWRPGILWTHVLSDALIAIAYYSIPLILFSFVRRRRDVPFHWLFVLFGVFIMACGTTHVLEVITVWQPWYASAGAVKAMTAVVSAAAAAAMVPIMPKALALPSLAQANKQLQAASGELRRSNQELEQFAYLCSHDLQEPLRMVSMYLDLTQRRLGTELDPTTRQYIDFAMGGAQRMRGLIDSLLQYSRLDRERPPPGATAADAALDTALEHLAPAIAEVHARITRGALPRVQADPEQLVLVFQNLVGNALKYGPEDEPWVHVSAVSRGDEVEFSVQDNGIGIDPAHHQRIFEVFQRLHDRDARGGGTGIGLAICKKIVERHGGRIWVESQLGTGAIFRFTLKACTAAGAA